MNWETELEPEETGSFKTMIIGSLVLAFVLLAFSAVTVLLFSDEFSLFKTEEPVVEQIPVVEQNLQDEIVFYKSEEEFFNAHPKRFKKLLNSNGENEENEKKLVSVTEAAFDLYHSPKTRLAVEWFYTDITKNREVALAILRNADEFNIPFPLAFSLAYAESKYKPRAYHVNTNGTIDRGLFQLNSSSFPNLTEAQFFDANTSAHYGLNHLSYCIKLGGNTIAGLAMYNAGQGKVKGSGTPFSTINYINAIVSRSDAIEQNFTLEVLSFYTNTLGYLETFDGK